MGLREAKIAYFSLLTHIKQLLLVTFCDQTTESGVSFRTHGMTNGRTNGTGWTDKRGSQNSYLDASRLCLGVSSLTWPMEL